MEQILQIFTIRQEDYWSNLLPIAKFAYNNALHSTKMTIFVILRICSIISVTILSN